MPNDVDKLPARSAKHETLQPQGWPRPRATPTASRRAASSCSSAAWSAGTRTRNSPKGFVAQAQQALQNIAAVLTEGGARPEHIVRLTWYVLDMDEYLAAGRELGTSLSRGDGRQFPGDGAGRRSAGCSSPRRGWRSRRRRWCPSAKLLAETVALRRHPEARASELSKDRAAPLAQHRTGKHPAVALREPRTARPPQDERDGAESEIEPAIDEPASKHGQPDPCRNDKNRAGDALGRSAAHRRRCAMLRHDLRGIIRTTSRMPSGNRIARRDSREPE